MPNNGHTNQNNHRDRMYEDRDEGNRSGDRDIDRGGMGQSGYAAGRNERDRSLDFQTRNQGYASSGQRDRHDIGADDRFSGRGGGDYRDTGYSRSSYQPERFGAQGGYGYSGNRDRGTGPRGDVRGYGHQFSGNEGYDSQFDSGRGNDQGPGGFGAYGGNRGYDQGYGGYGGYGNRGYDQAFGYGNNDQQSLGGYGGQSIHGDYGSSESERGVWSTDLQRGRNMGSNAGWGHQQGQGGNQGQGYSHRGKGPQGWQRSDEKIKDLVCEALTDDHHIDATGIDVEVKSGEVTLSGMVPDRQTKRLAEDLVERISGVKDVTNSLKVSADERMKYGRAQQTGSEKPDSSSHHPSQNGMGKDDKKARA